MEINPKFFVEPSKKIFKTIIFSLFEVKSYYRYADEFQIYPYPYKNIPKSGIQDFFPLVLEYRRDTNENDITKMSKSLFSKEDRLLTLLNSFTKNYFFKSSLKAEIGYRFAELEKGNKLELEWFVTMAQFPPEASEVFLSEFTSPTFKEVPIIQHREYFFGWWDYRVKINKPEFTIPHTLTRIFDSYFKKKGNVLDFLSTATDYVSNAVELFNRHKTLSLISSYTAIEAMVNLDFRDFKAERCKECNQLKYSVRKKFVLYLLRHIGISDYNEKLFKKFYDKRSSIIHKGDRLLSEKSFNYDVAGADKEYEFRVQILQLSRQAITNWLLVNTE